jgi:hypothetical protein
MKPRMDTNKRKGNNSLFCVHWHPFAVLFFRVYSQLFVDAWNLLGRVNFT